jgi:hypothetical protein
MAKIANNYVSKPNDWIVNSTDKGRKSIKNGKVYLKDSEEFQIELFNPLTECVLTEIKLNGQPISKTGLVIKPGQRFYLDCFIDDNKKFIFSTYEVEQTLESLSAINNNGKLEVFFYKESVVSVRNWRDRFNTVIIERHYPSYPTYPYWTTTPYYGTGTNIGTVTTTNTTLTSNASGSYTLNSLNSNTMTQLNNSSSIPIAGSLQNQIETGRVERGDKSNQKFTEVDMDFDKYHISSVVIELLPESRKPETASELSKKLKGDSLKKKINDNDSDTIIDLIKKLGELHKAGVLTDDEFSEKKKELLSKIC